MPIETVLVVGATGSVGQEVVPALTEAGLAPRALVRDARRAERVLPAGTDLVVGDLTDVGTLDPAVNGVDAVVLTHGSESGDRERVDYGGVRNVLTALGTRRPRIALMSTIYVTRQGQGYGDAIDWKRRAEWLVRASGAEYTIVRPGWFGRAGAGDDRLVLEQGDTGDGGVRRDQIAAVLVRSLLQETAARKTLELFARRGDAPVDWSATFAPLDADTGLDGAHDGSLVPLEGEPDRIQRDVAAVRMVDR